MSENTEFMTPADEYDFSGDAAPKQDLDFEITGFERKEFDSKEGDGKINVLHVFKVQSDELPFPLEYSGWAVHTNEDAQRIGRGALRRLALKATDGESTKYDAEGSPLVGQRIRLTVYEDDSGFRRVKNPKTIKA